MKLFLTGLVLITLSMTAYGQKQEEAKSAKRFELYIKGKAVKGYGVSYRSGKVLLSIAETGSSVSKYNISDISMIKSPMPKILKDVLSRIRGGKFRDVVKVLSSGKGQELFVQNYYLGWGKRLTFGYCYALIKEGKVADALPLLRKARTFVHSAENKLDDQYLAICAIAVDVAKKDNAAALAKLKKEMSKLHEKSKPYVYNLLGDLETDNQLAIISYYKALLLDKTCPWQRYYARSRIAAIYESQGDKRSKLLTKFK